MSKELSGKTMSNAELEEIMKDFHVTKDNKISEKQFKEWWASGKQGLSPLMRGLLGAKLNTLRFFDSISENLKRSMDESASEATHEDMNTNQVSLNFNKFEQSGIMISGKMMFFSPVLEEEHNRHKLKHRFEGVPDLEEKAIFTLAFPVKNVTPEEAVAKITELVDSLGLPHHLRNHISIIQDLEQVCIGFPSPKKVKKEELDSFRPVLEQVQKQAKANQDIEFIFRLATSPRIILTGEEPVLMELLKGFSLNVKVNLWKRISTILTGMLSQGQFPESLMPIIGGISPAFLLRINGKIDIEFDETMKEALMTNPLLEPFMMPGSMLVMSASQVHSDEEEEFNEHFANVIPENFRELVQFLLANVGDEVNFFGGHSLVGFNGRVNAEDMASILKTAIKFMK